MTDARLNQILHITDVGFDDISRDKQLILARLIHDTDVLELLDNSQLDPTVPEDYINHNIFSRLIIPDTNTDTENYICFEIDDTEDLYSNNILINKVITFMVVCNKQDIVTKWGIDRHDLLGYLIKDLFNWSNILGVQIHKFYDIADVSENGYYYRVIKFKTISTNGLVNGVTINRYD